MDALAALGAFREATDLVQEATTRVREVWAELLAALHDLLRRARLWRSEDAVARLLAAEIDASAAAVDALVARLRPGIEAELGTLAETANRAVPVFTLFDTAIDLAGAAGHLAGLSAEMTGRGDLEAWSGAARESYDRRVREQITAADVAAEEAAATSRWLTEIGTAGAAYVTKVGHRGAELVNRLAEAAVQAVEAAPAELARIVTTLDRLEMAMREE
ncbi:hypothetical protein ACIA5D_04005 [Actinoplanes sp. NPDC051513]|uniref:hypothetical protein n=1 Tax=Actinoplanes sp. NPDC051513 TaxID=3363908 RepID=UPI00378C5D26